MEEVVFGLDYRMSVGRPEKAKKNGLCSSEQCSIRRNTFTNAECEHLKKKSCQKRANNIIFIAGKKFSIFPNAFFMI
jgi:hypothetical protein